VRGSDGSCSTATTLSYPWVTWHAATGGTGAPNFPKVFILRYSGRAITDFIFLRKRLEAGYEPSKRPTQHSGDVIAVAPDQDAMTVNPHIWGKN